MIELQGIINYYCNKINFPKEKIKVWEEDYFGIDLCGKTFCSCLTKSEAIDTLITLFSGIAVGMKEVSTK